MDSTGALDLPDIPESLLVVGGGYIGLELGSVYAALGSAVTVVEMTPGCCRAPIATSSTSCAKRVEQTMHAVLLNTRVVAMKAEARGIRVDVRGEGVDERPKEQIFDRVLVSVGRRPNSAVPGLDEDARAGSTSADSSSSTSSGGPTNPSIFAIGDVVGEPMLAHKASHEGRVAVEVDRRARTWRSSRRRFRPSSSPIPRSPGAG